MNSERIFVGLSGGVDSSVAALLLKRAGHEVTGVHLRCVNLDGCADADAEDARRVAEHLGIPFYVWDFEERYRSEVVDPLLAGYRAGETPNPDVACNREIKFGAFLDASLEAGADAIATGHYARIVEREGLACLAAGADADKDQSYFLAEVPHDVFDKVRFPLGGLAKPEVREIAAAAGLPTAHKKDSQGICFLGKVSLSGYLRTQLPEQPGIVLDTQGTEIGEHDGAWFHTVGQRSGFRVTAKGTGGHTPPRYVVSRDVGRNVLVVAEAGDEELSVRGVVLRDFRLSGSAGNVLARTRYRQPLAAADLQEGIRGWELRFREPHSAPAAGQAAVCYDAEGTVVATGTVAESF